MQSLNHLQKSECFKNTHNNDKKYMDLKEILYRYICRFFHVPLVSSEVRFDTISLIMMAKCVYFQQIHMLPSTQGPPKHAVL